MQTAMSSSFCGTPLVAQHSSARRSHSVKTQALWGKKNQVETVKSQKKAAPRERKQSVLEAFDFSKTRSKADANLLYEAKYGKRGADGKMTKEQYQALRRKVGGTAKDYWKSWVDVQGDYTDKGYVSRQRDVSEGVPGLPFLIGIVVALFGALSYVVSQTS